jgi:hypothetical protein
MSGVLFKIILAILKDTPPSLLGMGPVILAWGSQFAATGLSHRKGTVARIQSQTWKMSRK